MQSAVLDTAISAVNIGLSILPVRADGSKAPALASWSKYQKRRATMPEVRAWFSGAPRGIALIGGHVSGGLEILDFDEITAFNEWIGLCRDHDLIEIVKRVPMVATPSGGRHLYYRHEGEQQGNQKLARGKDMRVRIETRGEGGYAIAPPSPPECHESRIAYRFIRGCYETLPTLTRREREALLTMARILNEYVEPVRPSRPLRPHAALGARPGDDYNARGDYEGLLEAHGWKRAGHQGDVALWTRPGKTRGISASSGYAGSRLFYVFSSNAAPFEAEKSYTPLGVYAELECGGDYKEASKSLSRKGFGH